jgi:hypothetical protein
MEWTDIWRKPFKHDHYGYVWDKDNVMTFTVDDLTEGNDKWMQEFCGNLVKALNDEECEKYENLHIEDGCDLYKGDELIGYFRGWGHLTGGLKLSNEEAFRLQDDMIGYVIHKISIK